MCVCSLICAEVVTLLPLWHPGPFRESVSQQTLQQLWPAGAPLRGVQWESLLAQTVPSVQHDGALLRCEYKKPKGSTHLRFGGNEAIKSDHIPGNVYFLMPSSTTSLDVHIFHNMVGAQERWNVLTQNWKFVVCNRISYNLRCEQKLYKQIYTPKRLALCMHHI